MIQRTFWLQRLRSAWEKAPILWLSGVRRVGKTTLAQALSDAAFLNCDLPSTVRRLREPELFYRSVDKPVVIFDEVHQLPDPSRLLKIGADEFPHLKILATGSSTLAATRKFRDSLTGRKRTLHLLPVLAQELDAFGVADLGQRLLHGGLPEPLLAAEKDSEFFTEWLDSYYARDVQELFRVGKRRAFLQLIELVLQASGGILDVTRLGRHTNLSRPTVLGYLEALQVTHLLFLVRPFFGGGRREILRQPKAYAFDTGFISLYRGWDTLRTEDCGLLWEHIVLETLRAHVGDGVRYWRDRQQREVDFVVPGARGRVDAVECKWHPGNFSARSLETFRDHYPDGANYIVTPQVDDPYLRSAGGLQVVVCSLGAWVRGDAQRLWQRSRS